MQMPMQGGGAMGAEEGNWRLILRSNVGFFEFEDQYVFPQF